MAAPKPALEWRYAVLWSLIAGWMVQMTFGFFASFFCVALLAGADTTKCPAAMPNAAFLAYVVSAAAGAAHCDWMCEFDTRSQRNYVLWGCFFSHLGSGK